MLKASRPKRKAPQPRDLVNKWAKEDDSDSCLPSTSPEDLSEAERSNLETKDVCTDNELSGWGEDVNNKATQTEFHTGKSVCYAEDLRRGACDVRQLLAYFKGLLCHWRRLAWRTEI